MTPLAKLAVGRTLTATRTFDPVSSIIIMVAAVSKADEGKARAVWLLEPLGHGEKLRVDAPERSARSTPAGQQAA